MGLIISCEEAGETGSTDNLPTYTLRYSVCDGYPKFEEYKVKTYDLEAGTVLIDVTEYTYVSQPNPFPDSCASYGIHSVQSDSEWLLMKLEVKFDDGTTLCGDYEFRDGSTIELAKYDDLNVCTIN